MIKYYLTSPTPALSLGGSITSNQFSNNSSQNLFPSADGNEASSGSVSYLCMYSKNTSSKTLYDSRIYVTKDTTSDDDEINLGLGTSAINGVEQTIANIHTAPVGVNFSHPMSYSDGLVIGDMEPNACKSVWFQRIINAGSAEAITGNSFQFAVDGDVGE